MANGVPAITVCCGACIRRSATCVDAGASKLESPRSAFKLRVRRETFKQPDQFAFEMGECFLGSCAIEVVYMPELDAVAPVWKTPLEQRPMLGFFHSDHEIRRR